MRSQKEVRCGIPLFARMTGRYRPHLSLREGLEQPPRSGAEKRRFSNPFYSRVPFPLALDDPGSVLAVKGPASPLRALDCSGPIRKTRCLRGERGGADQPVILYLI